MSALGMGAAIAKEHMSRMQSADRSICHQVLAVSKGYHITNRRLAPLHHLELP